MIIALGIHHTLKAVVATFNQENALLGALSMITNLCVDLRLKLYLVGLQHGLLGVLLLLGPGASRPPLHHGALGVAGLGGRHRLLRGQRLPGGLGAPRRPPGVGGPPRDTPLLLLQAALLLRLLDVANVFGVGFLLLKLFSIKVKPSVAILTQMCRMWRQDTQEDCVSP